MGGDLVEVELDEEGAGPGPGHEERRRAASRRARRAGRRVPARWYGRLAAALAAFLAVGAGLDGAVAARLADPQPGRLADLRAPRAALWGAPGTAPIGVVGDAILLTSSDGGSVTARALADGRVRWTQDVGGCRVVGRTQTTDAGARLTAVTPEDARLVCLAGSPTGDVAATIVDAVTGEVLATVDAGWNGWSAAVSDDLVVLPVPAADGSVEVAAYSLVTGERLWGAPAVEGWDGSLTARDGVVVVREPDVVYDLRTGRPASLPAASAEEVALAALPDGGSVRSSWDGAAGATTQVVDPDGSVRWTAEGLADVAGPDMTVVPVQNPDGGRDVRDPRDGSVLWSMTADELVVGEVAGVVVAVDLARAAPAPGSEADASADLHAAMVGLDARTGSELWSLTSDLAAVWSGIVTDGTRFAVGGPDGVEVHDARTGRRVARWRVPGQAGTTDAAAGYVVAPGSGLASADASALLLALPGDRLVLVRAGETVLLGW